MFQARLKILVLVLPGGLCIINRQYRTYHIKEGHHINNIATSRVYIIKEGHHINKSYFLMIRPAKYYDWLLTSCIYHKRF